MALKNKAAGGNPAALAVKHSSTSKLNYTTRGILVIALLGFVFCINYADYQKGGI